MQMITFSYFAFCTKLNNIHFKNPLNIRQLEILMENNNFDTKTLKEINSIPSKKEKAKYITMHILKNKENKKVNQFFRNQKNTMILVILIYK